VGQQVDAVPLLAAEVVIGASTGPANGPR